MTVDYDSIALGNTLGTNIQTADNLNQQRFESENITSFNVVRMDSVRLSSTTIISSLVYPSDSFILDHPVYGELDSSILKLDGGYAVNIALFPLTYPILFGTQGGVMRIIIN
jgi:hypothetical protein